MQIPGLSNVHGAPEAARQSRVPDRVVQLKPGAHVSVVRSAPKPTITLCACAAVGAVSDEITGKAMIDAKPTFLTASLRDNPLKGEIEE